MLLLPEQSSGAGNLRMKTVPLFLPSLIHAKLAAMQRAADGLGRSLHVEVAGIGLTVKPGMPVIQLEAVFYSSLLLSVFDDEESMLQQHL